MTKPDWAERLQRSRRRQCEKGWADCEARIIKLLKETSDLKTIESGRLVNYADIAIALIKGENK